MFYSIKIYFYKNKNVVRNEITRHVLACYFFSFLRAFGTLVVREYDGFLGVTVSQRTLVRHYAILLDAKVQRHIYTRNFSHKSVEQFF